MGKEQNECTPLVLTNMISEKFPNCWHYVDLFRAGKERGEFSWDDRCYVPISCCIEIARLGKAKDEIELKNVYYGDIIAATAPWREYKQIYTFSAELQNLLMEQDDDFVIPIDVLSALPFQSIYQVSGNS